MSFWTDQMDLLLVTSNRLWGKATTYQRPGFTPFAITGQPMFVDRLQDPQTGPFDSIFYRIVDFNTAPFAASVTARFTSVPNADGTITFDGVTYTDVLTLDNSTPRQFLRGSSSLGVAANLSAAINADPAVAGVLFSSSTVAHPTCTAAWLDNDDTSASVIVSYKAAGAAGDIVIASEHMTAVSLDKKIFYGGLPLENDLITLLGTLYRVSDVPEPDTEGGIHLRLEKKAL